ncbi:class I SAM-dependent methyltransferase [Nonomuraea sp. JJY05]|uniref:class I SAM-dependent methyltransferase n=1 Tax=Nonomuraea sp. JJY05 TaxID=3350255 RepID=UPI00373F63FA
MERLKPSFVAEVASNDGYLLQHVVERGIRCLGIEPSANVGQAAKDKGVPTLTAFLTPETGAAVRAENGPADLVVANNVYAHIPDVIGFTEGLRALVADDGWVSIEVQHLLTLMELNQYDTIYHEHFQYYTVASAQRALASGGLTLVDVELLPTHGGSIRLWARPSGDPSDRVLDVLAREKAAGLHDLSGYAGFAERVARVRRDLLRFLIDAAEEGKTVVGYGAPGKGNTLLNHCGIRQDLLAYTVDRNPYKHGRFTPGTRIPIAAPERIAQDRPDYVLVLPWNLREELTAQLSYVHEWGGRLVFPIPHLEVV